MPINTSSVPALIKSLLAAPASPLDDMRIDAFYTGNFVDPAHNFAAWGILPVGGFADGDIAALKPVQGKPIAEWPVLRFSHAGDPGRHFASSIHTWLPAHLIEYETENEDLADITKDLVRLGAYLGDKGRTGKVLEAIRENDLPSSDAALRELAEGKDSLLHQYHAMSGKATELKSLLKNFPDFADARYQLFDADGIPEGKATLAAAWDILCLDILMDGSYKRVREIALYLVEHGRKAYADDPRLKAVEAMAAKALCGDAWFKAAEKLESEKKHRDAYLAYRNAAYWIHVETGTALDATWLGGKRAAAAIGDKNLLSLFAPFKATQSKDLSRVLGKYAEYSERKAKAVDTQKLLAPFFAAARKGDTAKLKRLIESGVAINAGEGEKDFTALHFAAQAGELEAVKLLVAMGADISIRSRYGSYTPFLVAVDEGRTKVAEFLLAQGADVNEGDALGTPALSISALSGHLDMVKLLVAKKAKLEGDDDGSALFRAVHEEHWDIARYLLSVGARAHVQDSGKVTALHWAAIAGSLDICKLLVAKGAKVSAKDSSGKTAADWADESDCYDIVEFLTGKTALRPTPAEEKSIRFLCKKLDAHKTIVRQLEEIDLTDDKAIKDADLKSLSALKKLTAVNLEGCRQITDKGIAHLAACPTIEYLYLGGTGIGDKALASLAKLPRLRTLHLQNTSVTNAGIAYLTGLQHLYSLQLSHTKVDDGCSAALARLTALDELRFSGTKFTGSGIEPLAGLKNLSHLSLDQTKLGDAFTHLFPKLPALTRLDLTGTGITDKSVAALATLKKINVLVLEKTKISAAGRKKLKAALPRKVSFSWG